MHHVAAMLLLLAAGPADAAVPADLELVLLADASRSISSDELRFQRESYAAALAREDVLNAIRDGIHGRIAVAYVEWAEALSQHVVVPWMIVDGEASASRFGDVLRGAPREAMGRTAIGSAHSKAEKLITGNEIEGIRKVIDLSADSVNS